MENKKPSNNFFSGLLLGVVVGGLLVFLFATEKGKKIFKILKEEGLKGASDLEELLDDEMESEETPEAVTRSPVSDDTATANGHMQPIPPLPQKQSLIQKTKSTGKRFFKGIRKRA